MATINAKCRDFVEGESLTEPIYYATATGGRILISEEGFEAFCRNFMPTGFSRRNLQEALETIGSGALGLDMAINWPNDVGKLGIILDVSLNNVTQVGTEPFEYCEMGPKMNICRGEGEEKVVEVSPLLRRQVELVMAGTSSKLQARLAQYWEDTPDQINVTSSTKDAVSELVAWLSDHAQAVFATVSDDGTLSIVSIFPNEVRFYVEIERNGSVEGAVTRQRRYALDVTGKTVDDFSPEVIVAAVESV